VHSLIGGLKALDEWSGACDIKADGLASGKGVVVAAGVDEAREVLREWYGSNRIPGGGADVLLEEKLEGRELSVFAIGDGRALYPFASACDYKRAGDGDTGPNTGGMGAYSPPHGFPDDLDEQVRTRIIAPALRGLLTEGERYIGVLYCGLMWTPSGPYVIEFNARFGDPETQVLMPRVNGDFAAFLKSVADGALDPAAASLSDRACVGVVLATADYPASSTPPADLPSEIPVGQDVLGQSAHVFRGSSGGRVLTVTALADDLASAHSKAYEAVDEIMERFGSEAGLKFRRDIATV
jgi:phosphoribosylamine--glycine ligase